MGGSDGGEDDVPLSVRADAAASPPVLYLRGELDMASAPQLEAAVDALAGEPAVIALDLTELNFLDSSGLTAIVRLHRRLLRRDRGKVVLRFPTPFVADILRIAGLDRVLDIETEPPAKPL